MQASSQDFSKGGSFVVSFLPPVIGWLLKKSSQKGGGGVTGTQDPPGYGPASMHCYLQIVKGTCLSSINTVRVKSILFLASRLTATRFP